jgi:hypothetical protein
MTVAPVQQRKTVKRENRVKMVDWVSRVQKVYWVALDSRVLRDSVETSELKE